MRHQVLLLSIALSVTSSFRTFAADGTARSIQPAASCALVNPCGDVNGSGEITSSDALAVLRVAVGQSVTTTCTVSGSGSTRQIPKTGQTIPYGPGSDGAVRAGASRSFTDNGDGTITDNTTGLMWEKKSDDGSIHDWNDRYSWGMNSPPYMMNGTMVTTFLATLNASVGFAGHTDWRIP